MTPTAGPLRQATLIVSEFGAMAGAYAALGLVPQHEGVILAEQARAWGFDALGGLRCITLARGDAGGVQLRLIERPGAQARPTRFSHGWLALEILVRDVDALAAPAQAAGFELAGAPADLDVSPAIRAMQLIGPAGEMLYLTQVKAPVPPFELPMSQQIPAHAQLDRLFIAVLSTPSRAATLAACERLAPKAVLQFETRISVLNRALGRPLETRWPVATLQLAGQCLFEIDEVQHAAVRVVPPNELPTGLAWITLAGQAPGALMEISPGAWVEIEAA